MSEMQRLQEQVDEADEYLPVSSGPYQTLGERAKLLKDQLAYALEFSVDLRAKVAALEVENGRLRAVLTAVQECFNRCGSWPPSITAKIRAALAQQPSTQGKEQG